MECLCVFMDAFLELKDAKRACVRNPFRLESNHEGVLFGQLGRWCSRGKVLGGRRLSCMALQSWLNAYMVVFMRSLQRSTLARMFSKGKRSMEGLRRNGLPKSMQWSYT